MFLPFRNRAWRKAADSLYVAAVRQARLPAFYSDMGVPDSLDGRFDLLSLHVFLIVDRLNAAGCKNLAQALFDRMFVDMDRSVRELGIGDLGVPKHMKRMMKAFNGRCQAYAAALAEGDGALREALLRNVYGGDANAQPWALAAYVRLCDFRLAEQSADRLSKGLVDFPEVSNDEHTDAERSFEYGMVAQG